MTTINEHPLSDKHLYLVGIGGAGMSGLARIYKQLGAIVSGSDAEANAATRALRPIVDFIGYAQDGSQFDEGVDLLVYSAAIGPSHPERVKAAKLGIRQLKYSQALGELSASRHTIAIAGTHGKTSTTSLLSIILERCGRAPGWVVGGSPVGLPASANWGEGPHFVVEACEFDRSFHQLHPWMGVLHNVEPDHLDFYQTFDNLKDAYRGFTNNLRRDGILFANWDDENVRDVAVSTCARLITYGTRSDAMIQARNVSFNAGAASFQLWRGSRHCGDICLPMPGWTDVLNALAACSVALTLGVPASQIKEALTSNLGVKRRFELVATIGNVPVIDDYAHHPTAVREIISTARRSYPNHKLCAVFQAHQYARLNAFFDGFAEGLANADEILICPTFAARETGFTPGQRESDLADAVRAHGVVATSVNSFDEVLDYLRDLWHDNRCILTVGAGDVTKVSQMIAARESELKAQVYGSSGRFAA